MRESVQGLDRGRQKINNNNISTTGAVEWISWSASDSDKKDQKNNNSRLGIY
jgi:hypothetical protein